MYSLLVIPIEASPETIRPLIKIDSAILEKTSGTLLADDDDFFYDIGPLVKSNEKLLLPYLQAISKEIPPSLLEILGFDFVARQENLPTMNLETRRFHSDLTSLPLMGAFPGSEIVATEYWTPFQGHYHHLVLHIRSNFGPTNLRNLEATSNLNGSPLANLLNRYFVSDSSPSNCIAKVARKAIVINVIESPITEFKVEDQNLNLYTSDFSEDLVFAQTRILTQALLFSNLRAELFKLQNQTNNIKQLSDSEIEDILTSLISLRRKWIWPRIYLRDLAQNIFEVHLKSLSLVQTFDALLLDVNSEIQVRERSMNAENLRIARESATREKKIGWLLGGFALSSLISSWWGVTVVSSRQLIMGLIGTFLAAIGYSIFRLISNKGKKGNF